MLQVIGACGSTQACDTAACIACQLSCEAARQGDKKVYERK